jgi:hypothetical protein
VVGSAPIFHYGLVRDALKWFRPAIDVALPGNLIESQTQVALLRCVFGPFFPFLSFVLDNVITQEEDPYGFQNLRRRVALFGDRAAVE